MITKTEIIRTMKTSREVSRILKNYGCTYGDNGTTSIYHLGATKDKLEEYYDTNDNAQIRGAIIVIRRMHIPYACLLQQDYIQKYRVGDKLHIKHHVRIKGKINNE
ncbi:MAG: hypothetical protein DRN71_04165 [Candidatus Nanohalarchaeota archaeon]|nr:MAG: hypothetical protein DRN71_04165 [Candidatus Nanohaloarchaeota archaeon]